MKIKKIIIWTVVIVILLFVLMIIWGSTIEEEQVAVGNLQVEKEKPVLEFETETVEPETFYKEIEIEPNRVYYWGLNENVKGVKKIDFDIQSDRGINVYFVKSKEDYEIYSRQIDRAKEKFQYYKGCKQTGTQSFKGSCNIESGGLMIGNTQSDSANVKISMIIDFV